MAGDTPELGTSLGFSGKVIDERHTSRAVNRASKDIISIGDTELIPAQGAGIRVRLLAMIIRTGLAASMRLKSAGNNLSSGVVAGHQR